MVRHSLKGRRPWSECEHLIRRSEKLPVKKGFSKTCLPSLTSPRSPRPSSEYDDLSRKKTTHNDKELQGVQPNEMLQTDHERINKLQSMVERDRRECMSRSKYHLQPLLKPENQVERTGKETTECMSRSKYHLQPLFKPENQVEREGKETAACMSRSKYPLQPLFKLENQVEREGKETADIGLPSSSISARFFDASRRYEDIRERIKDSPATVFNTYGRPDVKSSYYHAKTSYHHFESGQIKSRKQPVGLHIPPETEKPSTTFDGKCEPTPLLRKFTEEAPQLSTHSLYFKMKHFPRFQYVYNLVNDCKSRVEKCGKGWVGMDEMFKNVNTKIVIVGSFTEDDLHLLTKSAEKKRMPKSKHIWKVQPLVCFENDFFSESNIKKSDLDRESTCHKILIKSDTFCDKRDKADDSITIVEKNKEQIKETITSCLEEPLHLLLQEWLEALKTECSSRLASGLIAEIEAIQKQMKSCNIKDRDVSYVLPSSSASSIVPDNIITFLFRRPEVHSFGIWWDSSFKVFVNKTDEKRLHDDLTKMNPTFFTKYNIDIETGKLKDKLLHLMQGDEIQANIPNKQKYHAGTLGGIVTKADDENKKYALTCQHLFPEVGQRAYTEKYGDIGACLYTTREKSCDFAAIEIEKSFSEKCNETFQNEDGKITNARVFSDSVTNVGIVHKIGATTKVTKGRVYSSEYYDKLLDNENRGHVFLVKGIPGNFSEEGDSGSLVFTRSKDAQQTCVEVLGMVYGNKVTVYDDDDDDDDDDDEIKCKNEVDKESINTFPSNEGDVAASNVKEGENISSCYRIHTALELFKQNKGAELKFKDNLSFSSSESDDSNEEKSQ